MQAAFHRVARPFPAMNIVCTKEMADPVLCLPPTARMIAAGYGDKFKAPSLAECIRFLFEEEMAGAHSALADCRYCARVFFELCTEPATAPL